MALLPGHIQYSPVFVWLFSFLAFLLTSGKCRTLHSVSRVLKDAMASLPVFTGRALFFAFLFAQNFRPAGYPLTYKDNSSWFAVAGSQTLSTIFWFGFVHFFEEILQRLFSLIKNWGLYILVPVIIFAILFG